MSRQVQSKLRVLNGGEISEAMKILEGAKSIAREKNLKKMKIQLEGLIIELYANIENYEK